MTGERIRFRREKESTFRLAEGSWESVLVGLKNQYPEDVFGVDEAGYWQPIEEKASMTLRGACFQYFLAGDGHKTLAKKVIDSNPRIRTAVGMGTMSTREKLELTDRIAGFLYDSYPKKYQEKITR
jgi:hypothetical protein